MYTVDIIDVRTLFCNGLAREEKCRRVDDSAAAPSEPATRWSLDPLVDQESRPSDDAVESRCTAGSVGGGIATAVIEDKGGFREVVAGVGKVEADAPSDSLWL